MRDSILQASGNLNLSRPVGSEIDEIDALINKPDDIEITLHQPSLHRSIYLSLLRHSPPPELAAFDLPDGVTIVGQRDETTLPTQSLFLFNNPFVVSQSEALAKKILAQAELNEHQRISKVFQQVLTREPSKYELEQAIQFVGDSPDEVWTSLVQALLATNEFRYID